MAGINEIKARIEQARDQVEFYNVIDETCIKGGYRFDDSETMRENADRAVMQGAPLKQIRAETGLQDSQIYQTMNKYGVRQRRNNVKR